MTEHDDADPRSPRPGGSKEQHPIAKSLFGGAILATVGTLAMTQTYPYVNSVNDLNASNSIGPTETYVGLGGYYHPGDGGGGVLLPQSTLAPACAPDNGQIFKDANNHCFVRSNPTNSVREWGAVCDISSSMTSTWTTGATGTLSIPGTITSPQSAPLPGENIVISQIGTLSLWGTTTPAVSMTRFSTLSNAGTGYAPGDLISFAGGTFSQQAAIIVDSVKTTMVGSSTLTGVIDRWHFLWGGLYSAASAATLTSMGQDNARSFCGVTVSGGAPTYTACGTTVAVGAAMAPAWSGWSVLNNQGNPHFGGTMYGVGDIVTLTAATGSAVNGTHYPTLIVENTDTNGAVLAYDWLDYGSFSTLSSTHTGTLTAMGTSVHGGTGLEFTSVAWAQAPFATTIHTASTLLSGGTYSVTLTEQPPFPASTGIQYLYYGHDDATAINNAIKAAPKGGLVIPAGCGTTQAINLSPPANANPAQNFATFLKGANLQSTGLYALGSTPSSRASYPLLAHVIYSGVLNSSKNGFVAMPGGGFSNMFLMGLGLPEGYGYWGLFENTGATSNAPAGYVGPSFTASGTIAGMVTNNIPTAGNVVEIDASSQMRIDKVLISDGGIGPGNSNVQCGLDESDPAQIFVKGSIANITLTDSRVDTSSGGFGATDPDFVLKLDTSCGDSVYTSNAVFGGTKADVLVHGGNLFSRIHLNSGAANSKTVNNTPIPWPYSQTFGLAGNADYGFYVIGNTSVSETQCDIANIACVFILPPSLGGSSNPGQITDTQMKCGSLGNTPPGYFGVELSAGTANTTVSGTAASTQCNVYPFQLVQLDGPVDLSTSLCGNSYAAVAGCTGYQGTLASGQSYTQPAVAYANGTLIPAGTTAVAGGLIAIPFVSPAVGATIRTLGIRATPPSMPASTQCLVGIYNGAAQAPTTLVAVGTASAMGTINTTGTVAANFTATLPIPGAQLAPGTLYFLAIACNNTITMQGVAPTGGLSGPLVGVNQNTLTATGSAVYSHGWMYPATSPVLPSAFGAVYLLTGAWVPNVYAQP